MLCFGSLMVFSLASQLWLAFALSLHSFFHKHAWLSHMLRTPIPGLGPKNQPTDHALCTRHHKQVQKAATSKPFWFLAAPIASLHGFGLPSPERFWLDMNTIYAYSVGLNVVELYFNTNFKLLDKCSKKIRADKLKPQAMKITMSKHHFLSEKTCPDQKDKAIGNTFCQ